MGSKPVSLVIKKGRQRQFGRWECKDNTDCITIELDVTKPRGIVEDIVGWYQRENTLGHFIFR